MDGRRSMGGIMFKMQAEGVCNRIRRTDSAVRCWGRAPFHSKSGARQTSSTGKRADSRFFTDSKQQLAYVVLAEAKSSWTGWVGWALKKAFVFPDCAPPSSLPNPPPPPFSPRPRPPLALTT